MEVGEADQSLVLTSIHPPAHWTDPKAWFNGGRADVTYGDEAVSVLLWLACCRRDDPGAGRQRDPSREVAITLDQALAGRVALDGVYTLVQPEGRGKHRSRIVEWTKVQIWDERTLIVYWFGAALYSLDRVETTLTEDALFVTVWEQPPGRLSGRDKCAILRLHEPLAGREVRQGPV